MENRYLYKAKRIDNGEWVQGYYVKGSDMYGKETNVIFEPDAIFYSHGEMDGSAEIYPSTICQCTGLKDKNGKLIFENDVLMNHDNPSELIKAVFGEFTVIDMEMEEEIDDVIGWHCEVAPTDALSKCEPFCYSMPLTGAYIDWCNMKVVGNIFDNPELLGEKIC